MEATSKGSPEMERPASPCWKKKQLDAGFLANAKDHLDQFVSTSMDQHRICLKKTLRGMGDFVKLKKLQGKPSSSSAKIATERNSGAKDAEMDRR